MNKSLIIRIWIDGSLKREFETQDDSWLDTRYIRIIEGEKIFVYSSGLSKGRVISFVYNSEGLVKEAF